MNDDFLSCFYHETRILRELEHPNILPIYDSGYSHNYLYRVVELCNARNLAEQLGQGLLPTKEVGRILRKVASALDAAHINQILHRDIKPASVVVDRERERVCLARFGPPLVPGTRMGTPAYMAPELFELQDLDARAEVYSLGVLVFEMLWGSLPLDAVSVGSSLAAHLKDRQAPALDLMRPDVPRRMAEAVGKAICRHAASRFATAGEFADEAWPDDNPEKSAGL